MLAKDLQYVSGAEHCDLEGKYEEVSKMLNSLIMKIKGA